MRGEGLLIKSVLISEGDAKGKGYSNFVCTDLYVAHILYILVVETLVFLLLLC